MKPNTFNLNKLVRREIHPAISIPTRENGVSTSAAVVDFVSSDESLDRYGEILVASGWQLENYRKNPVVQNAHNYGDILFTIGRALATEVRGGRLFQRIEFATEVNPVARIAYGLYKGKFLNAVSVGFIPVRWETGGPDSPFVRKYLEQELVEVSAVGIPANPNALQVALEAGAVRHEDLEEVVERLEGICAQAPGARTFLSADSAQIIPGGQECPRSALHAHNIRGGQECPRSVPMNFCSQEADSGADTGALGAGVLGAHWGQLTQLLNETRAVLRRASQLKKGKC